MTITVEKWIIRITNKQYNINSDCNCCCTTLGNRINVEQKGSANVLDSAHQAKFTIVHSLHEGPIKITTIQIMNHSIAGLRVLQPTT